MSSDFLNDYCSTSDSEQVFAPGPKPHVSGSINIDTDNSSSYPEEYVQSLHDEIDRLRAELNIKQVHPEWRPRVNPATFDINYWTSVIGC